MKSNEILKFLQYLLLPLFYGLALWSVWLFRVNAVVVLAAFIANFIGFLAIFIWRGYRHAPSGEHLFKATVTPSIGFAVELLGVCYVCSCGGSSGMAWWVIALYLTMLFMLDIALFAYAIALKALSIIKMEESKKKL